MTMNKWLIAAVMAAGMGTGASAASISYDYTGSATNPGGPALSCGVGGIFNANCSVTYNNAGLGIDGNPDLQPGTVDGIPNGSSETLRFDFGFDRVWDELTFGLWDGDDDVTLSWASGSTSYGPGGASTVSLGGVVSSFLEVTASGDFWSFTDGLIGNDQFTVAELTVSSVPLPAGGLLMLTALGGVAALRRKRKAA